MTRLLARFPGSFPIRAILVLGVLLGAAGGCETYLGPDGDTGAAGGLRGRPVLTGLEIGRAHV